MQAYNRPLYKWFNLIELGQLTLPRFQRFEAWTHNEVSNLLRSMLRGLPTGAALILRVDGPEQFRSKHIAGTPQDGGNITEQLLDGQQRLTAMWKSLHDLYENRKFLVSIDKSTVDSSVNPSDYLQSNEIEVVAQAIYEKNGKSYPMWVNDAKECWERGLIPVHLLRPVDISKEKKTWLKAAEPENIDTRDFLDDLIDALRERIKHFNLPYLELPSTTRKHVALDVFIKLNTSSVKLTAYDIVVALVEDAAETSLHELVDSLAMKVPQVKELVSEWDDLVCCFTKMVELLEEEHIYDEKRLPSYTALPVLAALTKYLPANADQLGNARHLLKKYLWRAFLTDRYEKATTTNSLSDFRKLRDYMLGKGEYEDIPIFNDQEYPAPVKEIISDAAWAKNRTILGRGLLALQIKCGAYDIADNTPATKQSVLSREYHHLFPAALLGKADLSYNKIFSAVNCALISWRTNRTISDKNPMQYLLERAENCNLGEIERDRRLRSHLIPIPELRVGYSDLDSQETKAKIREDFALFVEARSILLEQAARIVYNGEQLTTDRVYAKLVDLQQQ
jgi:hypothetical protein